MNKKGDVSSFDNNWNKRPESYYNHWIKTEPENQIQLAFRMHWLLFKEIIDKEINSNEKLKVLEVGCGRGSLSSYFYENGFDCSLLDISEKAIKIAKDIFKKNQHKGEFYVGDAENLEFKDSSFDVIFSIGLLEHFTNPEKTINEQFRLLKKGGIWFGYIVPEFKDNVQKDFDWINNILKGYKKNEIAFQKKEEIFRSDNLSDYYFKIIDKLNISKTESFGTYPLPMISHSIEFPFSLMPKASEKSLVNHFIKLLDERKEQTGNNPWICKEGEGNAFLIWGRK